MAVRGLTRSAVALVVLAAMGAMATDLSLHLNASKNELSYFLSVNGAAWLNSADTRFYADGQWYSIANRSLEVTSTATTQGSDSFGAYRRTTANVASPDSKLKMILSFYVYNDNSTIIFEQTYATSVANASVGSWDVTSGAFPSFSPIPAKKLGVASWLGTFIDNSVYGPNIGYVGTMEAIPAGSSLRYIISASDAGLNNAMTAWGAKLMAMYNKTTEQRDNDYTLQYLGYNTDHGAYYYYKPDAGGDYNSTLVRLWESANKQAIPYKWILLDSWWYYKGPHDGVLNWTAMPSIFPPGGVEGLQEFNKITQWPVIGHNRWWSPETSYSKQNGGEYDFSDKNEGSAVVPLEQRFWDDLLKSSATWGLTVYEQDWLYNELEKVPMLTKNITMGREWLLQMGLAATRNNMTIQYCMPCPYQQWHLGSSAILAHALGLAPFKVWLYLQTLASWIDLRESVVSTLTAGPVAPGDGAEFQNKVPACESSFVGTVPTDVRMCVCVCTLIMRSCRADGRLISPDRPATNIDAYFMSKGGFGQGPQGHVWSSYTTVGSARFEHVMSTQMSKPYNLSRNEAQGGTMVAYAMTNNYDLSGLQTLVLGADDTLPLRKSTDDDDLELWHMAPVNSNGVAVLGDLTKWIPVAKARFPSITDSKITVAGGPNETVTVTLASVSGTSVSTSAKTVTLDSAGQGSISF
ncbi:uncharacterized protein MONBRDRAFT_34228 [Monosiga brevicollis MX1]|uniref:Alpha-L-fucosidase n=1 Tax=Monosiga brevicollis TaxID=81824 RepID=A9VAC6_MONBE|nr:uncharacterized protein MONBRDRAFT_34228 [Monosiga brevicollis MX1]EDQ85462.1 predicted protein [Monosiga brevicollis MX1]|eukprot:XP_001749653.1 hypothetical protein [Monosiga brevicollis MX1]